MINRKVFIVAGHDIDGDPGATYGAFREAQETVQISEKLAEILRQYPVEVIVDPYTNDMYESVKFVNARCSGIDDGIVIDVHKNSFSAPAYGLETWIMRNSDSETISLGTAIQQESINTTGLVNRGVKNENWYVITNAKCRGALVECGFINGDPNSDDYDYKYALGIARGILRFFGISFDLPKPTPAPVPTPKPTPELVMIDIPNKIFVTTKDVQLWDLTFSKWADAKSVKALPKGTQIEVSATVDHPLGGRYLISEYSFSKGILNGVNVADVVEYKEPAKPVQPTPVEPEKPEVSTPEVPQEKPEEQTPQKPETDVNPSEPAKDDDLHQLQGRFDKLVGILRAFVDKLIAIFSKEK